MTLRNCWTGALLGAAVFAHAASAHTAAGTTDNPFTFVVEFASAGDLKAADDRVTSNEIAAPRAVEMTKAALAVLPTASGDEQFECLAKALYFEARGESVPGQFAVAEVILNRRDSGLYPATVCGVVRQGGGGGCQFSFTCDQASDRIREQAAYAQAGKIARLMLDGADRPLTEGATHFHTRQVKPGWSRKFSRTASIGAHVFYRQPGA